MTVRVRRWLGTAVVVALLAVAAPAAVAASSPEATASEPGIVVQGRVFAESEYRFLEYPKQTRVTLVADSVNVLQVHRAGVYFWPLTNEWRVDRELVDEAVDGQMEILDGGRVVEVIEATSFVLQQDGTAMPRLEFGEAAERARAAFESGRSAWLEDDEAYRAALAEQRELLAELADIARDTGVTTSPDSLPPRPTPPEPFTLRSTSLDDGYPVQLPEGSYELRLVDDDGLPVEGSRRPLSVIAPGPEQLSYQVVPEQQWTEPEESDGSGTLIAAPTGSALFLVPEVRTPYDARAWSQLVQPQRSVAGLSGLRWIPTHGALPTSLETSTGESLPLRDYQVVQQPGERLGYEIRPADGGRVDLQAYRVTADAATTWVRPPATTDLPGDRRLQSIGTTNPLPAAVALVLAVPAGLVLILRRIRGARP